ncbi:hypothetical protein RQP46_006004 [Phenoliferia psychrophenolica]
MQNLGKSAMRQVHDLPTPRTKELTWFRSSSVAKNSIKGYSDVQTKVRDATSNDAWGPSGTQNDFVEIIEMLDKRLNDKGKNWRHVFKSLTLLDYMLHSGSENVVMYFRENMYVVKTLKEFQYIDEYGKDQGANVRQKAKDITNLLLDEKRMRDSRKNRANMNGRLQGDNGDRPRSSLENDRGADRDLAAAIAASKASAEDESRRGQRSRGDQELEEAMRLSREDDERRKRELASQNGDSLFDEQRQNNDNLIDIDTPFTQAQQPMMTGFQSYNPYAAQQQQMQQEEWARQQQMAELQRQADEQQAYQNMLQQQQYAQQQQQAQEEYVRQQQYQQYLLSQQQQQQPLVPQPTAFGSNNPFAAFAPAPTSSPPPPLPQSNSFSNFQPTPAPAPAPIAPTPTAQRPQRDDGKHAHLANLLAGGREDGLDTFGNIGNMRVPVGAQFAQRTGINAQQTGQKPNPFTQQQQQQPKEQTLFDF